MEIETAAEKESLHSHAERHAVYTIIDAVSGLSLGLGAFSLTELPASTAKNLFLSVGFFGFSYLIIFVSWMGIRIYFEDFRVYGPINMILFFTGFFIAIMPVPIRIILMQFIEPTSIEVLEAALTLYSLCMCAIALTTGIFSFAFTRQSCRKAPWKDLSHLLQGGSMSFAMGLVFLISVFIPYEKTTGDMLGGAIVSLLPPQALHLPLKVGFWFLGGVAIAIPVNIVTRLILWVKRPR